MTPATATKVSRLLHEKRVMPHGAASVYTVRGDHDTYRVILGEDFTICSCPALRERCSHVEAAELLHAAIDEDRQAQHVARRSPSPVEGRAA